MNRLRDDKRWDQQKPIPGCMGVVINMFDLSAGMAGTKLLADKPHPDGYPLRNNRSIVAKRAIDHVGIHVGDIPIANEQKKSSSNKKSNVAPMKMLIAQELSNETDSKRKSPGVIARLMGLDEAVPDEKPALVGKRGLQEAYPRSKSAGSLRGRRQQDDVCVERPRSCEIHSCSHEKEYKDVYEVLHQPSMTYHTRDQSPVRGRCNENQNDKRMALVRQKFLEAKGLVTDKKLLQSKEFQDALEVLSSNRDLFVEFLEEPNSLFSKQMKDLNTAPLPSQTKRITVLKPSSKAGKHERSQQHPSSRSDRETCNLHRISTFSHPKVQDSPQPTRIVVLKPSPAKIVDKNASAVPFSSPERPQQSDRYTRNGCGEAMGSREVAKEITRQMRESMSSHHRDESLLSSVLSNGYIGDDSSFHKSEHEFIEDVGNLSHSEIVTPTSGNSWDYVNRMGSPYSVSSFSRASHSPESSVILQAKKRLSERWSMVATDVIIQESKQGRRSSSTLGEMLSITEVKREEQSIAVATAPCRISCHEEDSTAPVTCWPKEGDSGESSPRILSRSKSVPVSSLVYEASDPQTSRSFVSKESTKTKSGRLSFKGKVSSFFSRSKKASQQKTIPSLLEAADDKIESGRLELICKNDDGFSQSVDENGHEKLGSPVEESCNSPSPAPVNNTTKYGTSSSKVSTLENYKTIQNLSENHDKLGLPANSSESQDQTSPTSVLDAPFLDDIQTPPSSQTVDTGCQQLMSRSGPMESVTRSLSWDDAHLGRPLPDPLKLPIADVREQNQVLFVNGLLSAAGLDNEKVNKLFTRWHSLDSPLDPVLLLKFLDRKEEAAKSRERRSNQRLLFDCVNTALLNIGKAATFGAYRWNRAHGESQKDARSDSLVSEEVWRLLRDSSCIEKSPDTVDMDHTIVLVDRLLQEEVAGREWAELMATEMDEVTNEIGEKVLEDLVGETWLDFTVLLS